MAAHDAPVSGAGAPVRRPGRSVALPATARRAACRRARSGSGRKRRPCAAGAGRHERDPRHRDRERHPRAGHPGLARRRARTGRYRHLSRAGQSDQFVRQRRAEYLFQHRPAAARRERERTARGHRARERPHRRRTPRARPRGGAQCQHRIDDRDGGGSRRRGRREERSAAARRRRGRPAIAAAVLGRPGIHRRPRRAQHARPRLPVGARPVAVFRDPAEQRIADRRAARIRGSARTR